MAGDPVLDGRDWRKIALRFAAAQASAQYVERAKPTEGPLFRVRQHWRCLELSDRPVSPVTMRTLLQGRLAR